MTGNDTTEPAEQNQRDQEAERQYELYSQDRATYEQQKLEISKRYEQWMLALSGGALGLSLAFVERIAQSPPGWTLFILAGGWTCLIGCLIVQLYSIASSMAALRDLSDANRENYRQFREAYEGSKPLPNLPAPESAYSELTRRLNKIARILLALGLALLFVFALCNVWVDEVGGPGGENDRQEQAQRTQPSR